MSRSKVENDYFEWMFHLVSDGRFSKANSYRQLLRYLHDVDFISVMKADNDRAYDGTNLRYLFTLDREEYRHMLDYLDSPCSVLEMMVALAIRCEETIMDDPKIGDRTGQWFWKMIVNLGLGGMSDTRFDEYFVEDTVIRFINREYDPDGRGGLFTINNCERDLRDMSIWTQLCYFLDTMI